MPRAKKVRPGNYSNRSDLQRGGAQPIRTATGQPYGAAGAQAASQRAVPLPQGPQATGAPAPPAPQPMPGSLGNFARPTERPTEPITAGSPLGPGPGPSVLGLKPDPAGDPVVYLEALYQRTADPHVLAMLQEARQANWMPAAPTPL